MNRRSFFSRFAALLATLPLVGRAAKRRAHVDLAKPGSEATVIRYTEPPGRPACEGDLYHEFNPHYTAMWVFRDGASMLNEGQTPVRKSSVAKASDRTSRRGDLAADFHQEGCGGEIPPASVQVTDSLRAGHSCSTKRTAAAVYRTDGQPLAP